jgi:hypothetical protein
MSLDLAARVVCGVVLDCKALDTEHTYGFYHKGRKTLLFTNWDNQEQEYADIHDLEYIELSKPDGCMLGAELKGIDQYDKELHADFDLTIPEEVKKYADLYDLPIVVKLILIL